jgi:hypothetical protein
MLYCGEKVTYGNPEENSSQNFKRLINATILTESWWVQPPSDVNTDNTFL